MLAPGVTGEDNEKVTPAADENQASSLAAIVSTIADGKAVTPLDKNTLRLQLIDQALALGITWATLGRLYGTTGPELKRDIHKLRAAVRREQHAQAAES